MISYQINLITLVCLLDLKAAPLLTTNAHLTGVVAHGLGSQKTANCRSYSQDSTSRAVRASCVKFGIVNIPVGWVKNQKAILYLNLVSVLIPVAGSGKRLGMGAKARENEPKRHHESA